MKSHRTLSLFVFVDALGWKIANRYPMLEGILSQRVSVESVLGYSSTCIPSILTGRLPREHGHFSFFHYTEHDSPFRGFAPLRLLPRQLTDRGRVRHLISKGASRLLGYSGYFQLYNVPFDRLRYFDYGEKRDLYAPGGMNRGVKTIFDVVSAKRIPSLVSNWRLSEEQNLASAKKAIESSSPPAFAYVYLADLDGILHEHGSCSEAVESKIKWYDKQLRDLMAVAEGVYDEVRLHVLSDHGMADVHRTLNLVEQVEALGLDFGDDYVAMYDATMARFWLLSGRAGAPIESLLRGQDQGRLLSAPEIAAHGCDFTDGKQGDLLFLMEPGSIICPSYMGVTPVAGMHGYDPTHEDSLALYATNVPTTSSPKDLTDFFGLMVQEAELAHGGARPVVARRASA